MLKNIISADEFYEWANNKEIEYASESISDGDLMKRLIFLARVGNGYKVTFGGLTLYDGDSFFEARSAYQGAA